MTENKKKLIGWLILGLLAVPLYAGSVEKPVPKNSLRANCELQLLQPSQAGSVYLLTFAPSREACLKMGDEKTKAVFRNTPVPKLRVPGPSID